MPVKPEPIIGFPLKKPKPSSNKAWFVRHITAEVLAVVLLATLISVGYYYQSSQPIKELFLPVHHDVTANWKTYTNSQYGFEFKYPVDWKEGNAKALISLDSPENIKSEQNCLEDCGPDISITYYSSINDVPDVKANRVKAKTLEDYVRSKDALITDVKKIIFAGQNGFEMLYEGLGPSYVMLIEKGGHIYELLFSNTSGKNELSATENQILSTFKFADSDTSNWKTYTNTKYGFEFKYPKDHTVYTDLNAKTESFVPAQSSSSHVAIDEDEKLSFCCEGYGLTVDIKTLSKPIGTKIAFAGASAYEQKGNCNQGSTERIITVPHITKNIVISMNCQTDLLNQILSTFRFMNVDVFCGGIAGIPCPTTGYICTLQGNYPDAGTNCKPIAGNDQQICAQVITKAKDPLTGQIKTFPTPCQVPQGWQKIN